MFPHSRGPIGHGFFAFISLNTLCIFSCSTGNPTDHLPESEDPLVTAHKAEVAAQLQAGQDGPDPCASNNWYVDGICDTFCPAFDRDCTPSTTKNCPALPAIAASGWKHSFKSWFARLSGSARHDTVEPLVQVGQGFSLEARFQYGFNGKSLEDENIAIYLRQSPCGAWSLPGVDTTDDEGRIHMPISGSWIGKPGAYQYALVVAGDHTMVTGYVWAVLPRQPSVVFDIDGTLTKDDGELLEDVILGSEAETYVGALDVVEAWSSAKILPIYLTGRPAVLQPYTREWLTDQGFPVGPVRTTTSTSEIMPSESGVGAFKLQVLNQWIDEVGLQIRAAYGNASTDICAYARAGIDTGKTFIIGANAGDACDQAFSATQAVSDYPSHLSKAKSLAAEAP